MKPLGSALPFALVAASLAGAADITLTDGRVLREAVVVRHDADTVTFRHTAGFAQIEKTKLPEPLAAEYPLDAAQAELEAEQQRQEVLARKAEADRLSAQRAQLAATAPKPEEVPVAEEPKQDTTTTTTWIDNYNTESCRLMRARARHHDHDRYSNLGNRRARDHRRDQTPPPPPPPPASTVGVVPPVHRMPAEVHVVPPVQMTPDVHMTPDVKMMGVDTPQSSTVPSPADTDQRPQGHRRF